MVLVASLGIVIALVVVYLAFGRKFFAGGINHITRDLAGKVVVITGANIGIGKETAKKLAEMGATIVLACRSTEKTLPVVDELKKETGNKNIEFIKLDLSDLKSVKEFADNFQKKYQRLDILINNAGVFPMKRELTKDGFEMMFGTNHLGHFYLTNLLKKTIENSAPSRIVNLSSIGHTLARWDMDDLNTEKKKYDANDVYCRSKIANILFTKGLQSRLPSNVKTVALHPGSITTGLQRDTKNSFLYNIMYNWIVGPGNKLFGKTIEQGAQTTLYCALEDLEKLVGGGYYADCHLKKCAQDASNPEYIEKLWKVSEEMINKKAPAK